MAEIEITIRADEDVIAEAMRWRRIAGMNRENENYWVAELCAAIAAALPKPRIVAKPGMVLRRRKGTIAGSPALVIGREGIATGYAYDDGSVGGIDRHGIDPDDWEVLLDAEDPS